MESVFDAGVLRWFRRLGYVAVATCAATSLASIVVIMTIDVVGRYLMNSPFPGAAELIELAMGVVVFSGLPLATAGREHVSLDYGQRLVPGIARRYVHAVADLMTAAIVGLLAWRVALKALAVGRYGDRTAFLQIPVAPIAWFIALMAAVTAVIFVLHAIADLRGAPAFTGTTPA